jgi:HlyD family secretion protein
MTIKSKLLRWGLPVLAVVLAASAFRHIATGRPAQATVAAKQVPASQPAAALAAGTVAGAGVVEPSSELVAIGAPVAGIVKSVAVRVGDSVKPGQVLFSLDDRQIGAEVRAREASLNVVRQNLRTLEVETAERRASLKLYESVGDPRATTQEEMTRRRFAVQNAEARLAATKAGLEEATAQLEQVRTQMGLLTVRAPVSAAAPAAPMKVLQVRLRAGEFAPAMQLTEPLITLGVVEPLHVKIDIDEADIPRADFRSAASVSARGASDVRVAASFVRIEPLVVPKRSLTNAANERVDTRVLQVVYALPAGAKGFYVGQQVDAFISTAPSTPKQGAKP